MKKVLKASGIVVAGILILMLALGVTIAFAQDGDDEEGTEDNSETTLPFFGRLHRRFGHGFGFGGDGPAFEGVTPRDELLADALDIELDDLLAAREEAHANWLAEMVEAGYLEQEQVDRMLAVQALRGVIDRQELVASALGLEPSELESAREEGKRLSDLLEEQGFTVVEFKEALQTAFEEAVQAAVPDTITQEQADLILNGEYAFGFGFHGRGGIAPRGGFHRHNFEGGWFGGPGLRGGFQGQSFEDGATAPSGNNI